MFDQFRTFVRGRSGQLRSHGSTHSTSPATQGDPSADIVTFVVNSPETITLPGSGLVFVNTYGAGVTDVFHTAIVAAENFFQSHFTNAATLHMSFNLQSLDPKFSGQNSFSTVNVSYATLKSALTSRATSADDTASINALPTTDPSKGAGFAIPTGYAKLLGLSNASDNDSIVLNSNLNFNFGQDAIGVLEHEISEGAMGRIGGLGIGLNGAWSTMDLFRYTAAGVHDFTGGKDGQATYFSADGTHIITQFPFHNSVSTTGAFDGFDFADWDFGVVGDSFGPGGPGSPGVVSETDLRVMDVLGWTRSGGTPPPSDDYADSLTDTTRPFGLLVNGSATGTLEVVGDRDWFSVQLAAGTSYVVSLQGQIAGVGTLDDPYLRVHNSVGTLLTENDDIVTGTNRDSQLTFATTTAGTYYVEAGAFNDGLTGTYKVSLVRVAPADDFANSLSDTSHPLGNVAVGGSTSATLESLGDRDWFSIQLVAGTSYIVNLQGLHSASGTLEDPYLRLHDSAGALLAENDDIDLGVNRDSQLSFTAAKTGTFYVEAGAFDDNYTGTYKVSVAASTPGDDFANSLLDTNHPFGHVVVGGTSTGTLEQTNDRDWFQVQLVAGTTYTVDLDGQHAGLGTLEDPYLRVHDANGALIAQNDDIVLGTARDSQLTFQAATTGTYYLEAGAFNDNYTGTYRVGLSTTQIADDFANSLADTTHPIGPGTLLGSSAGTLEVPGDRDWFGIQLSAGSSYVIDLHGAHSGAGTLSDPYLRIYDSGGTLLFQNDDIRSGNHDSEFLFTSNVNDTFYFEAGAFNDARGGTYQTWVSHLVDGDTFANNLNGGAENDVLRGFAGSDTLNGAAAVDTLIGGLGQDILTGGPGADVFRFNSKAETKNGLFNRDSITDFEQGVDRIDLSGIDADARKGGNQTFKFVAGARFHHNEKSGLLHFVDKEGFVIVEGDTNGDGRPDFQIEVHGAAALAKLDFIL